MDIVANFEEQLMKLDPVEDDEFVLKVDELIDAINPEIHEKLIPTIFGFFEKNSLADCGAPGTLVHLTEHYYPNYLPNLISSIKKKLSYNAIFMINRILNSELPKEKRKELLSLLEAVKNDSSVHSVLREEAENFIEYQSKKNS